MRKNSGIATGLATSQRTPQTVLLNLTEVAAYLKVTTRTVSEWRRKRSLPHLRISRKCCRYRLEDIDRWMQSRTK